MDFKFCRGTLLDHDSKILKWFIHKCHSLLSSASQLTIYLHICWKCNYFRKIICCKMLQHLSALVPLILLTIVEISFFKKITHFYFLGFQRRYFDRNNLYTASLPVDRSYKEHQPKVLHFSFPSAAQTSAIKRKVLRRGVQCA